MPQELSRPAAGDLPPSHDVVADRVVARVRATEEGAAAEAHLRATDERTLADQVALTEIPAPPFGEGRRAARMADLMRDASLEAVDTDAEGNVLGWYPRPGPGPGPLILSAHLDTVFPDGMALAVRREGGVLRAPGIADDGRGLAGLLAVVRALRAGAVRLRRPLLVVATVGEEGVGDLRGVRHLFGPDGAGRDARGFVSLDGAGASRVVVRGVGSWRARVTLRGPGGHSWVDWGTANPVHALAAGLARMAARPLPEETTFSVGRIGGGTSVNAIPGDAWAELEVRSRSTASTASVVARLRSILDEAVEDANRRRSDGTPPLALDVTVLGDRPPGSTDPDAPLVRAALAATRAVGRPPSFASSSTDANLPMSLGIPAVTIGAGGRAGGAHTLEEWYDNQGGPDGLVRALLLVLAADEMGADQPPRTTE